MSAYRFQCMDSNFYTMSFNNRTYILKISQNTKEWINYKFINNHIVPNYMELFQVDRDDRFLMNEEDGEKHCLVLVHKLLHRIIGPCFFSITSMAVDLDRSQIWILTKHKLVKLSIFIVKKNKL